MTVNGTKLAMVRGDSESITVQCTPSFVIGDIITFTVRKTVTDPIVIQKTVSTFDNEGKALIIISPGDTESLDFDDYVYDIQLTSHTGAIMTIIEPSRFRIKEEVTY